MELEPRFTTQEEMDIALRVARYESWMACAPIPTFHLDPEHIGTSTSGHTIPWNRSPIPTLAEMEASPGIQSALVDNMSVDNIPDGVSWHRTPAELCLTYSPPSHHIFSLQVQTIRRLWRPVPALPPSPPPYRYRFWADSWQDARRIWEDIQ